MECVIQKKYFIGKSKLGMWSSLYTYKPTSLEVRQLRGEIFAVICLQGPKNYDLPTVGNMLLDKFHETYFENRTDSSLVALEKANIGLSKYLQKFLENDKAGDIGVDLNFISMVVIKDLLYVVRMGEGKFMIHRQQALTDASDLLRDPTMEGMIQEASMVTQDNDVYFLGTKGLVKEVINEELEEVAANFSEKILKNRLYKDEASVAMIMVGLNVDRNRPEFVKSAMKNVEVENIADTASGEPVIETPETATAETVIETAETGAAETKSGTAETNKAELETPIGEVDNTSNFGTGGVVGAEVLAGAGEIMATGEAAVLDGEENIENPNENRIILHKDRKKSINDEAVDQEVKQGESREETQEVDQVESETTGEKSDLAEDQTVGDLIANVDNQEPPQDKNTEQVSNEEQDYPEQLNNADYEAEATVKSYTGQIPSSIFAQNNSSAEGNTPVKNRFNIKPFFEKIISGIKSFFGKIKNLFSKRKRLTPLVTNLDENNLKGTQEEIPVNAPIKLTANRLVNQDLKTYQIILQNIKNGFVRLVVGIKKLVWDNWLGFGGDDLYLRSSRVRQRKWGLLVVLALVVGALLYFSVQGLIESQNVKKEKETAQLHLDAARKIVTEVNLQADILAKAAGNTERKNAELQKLVGAQTELDLAGKVKALSADIQTQEDIIVSIKDKFDRTIPLEQIDFIVDFAGKFPNANIVDMVGMNKTLYAIDNKYGKLYSIDYSGNIAEIVGGLNAPRSLTYDDKGNLIVLDSDPDKAIAVINPQSKSVTRLAATSNSTLSGVSQIEFYLVNGKDARIYLLNNSDKSIGYYSRTGSSYSTYNKRNSMEELATAKDFGLIDNKIYILMQKNLGLYRDLNQKEDVINLTGLKEKDDILSATALYLDGTYIYVGDPVSKRVMIFIKNTPDIPFVAQYVYRGDDSTIFSDIKEIYTDKDTGKIFVLSNSKIFVLNLGSISNFIL